MKKSSRRALEVESLESVMLLSTVAFATVSESLVAKSSHVARSIPTTVTSQVQLNAHVSQGGLTTSRPISFSRSVVTPTTRVGTSMTLPTTISSVTARSQQSRGIGSLSATSSIQFSQVHAMVLPGGKPVVITQPTSLETLNLPSATRVASSASIGNVGGGIKFV